MDAGTGKVLAAVNPHLRLPMASTTKVMVAILALQMGKLDDKIKVPKAAFNYESDATVMGLKPGEIVTLRDLLYGLMLPSGVDAANTIAIHYAGSEKAFIALMNQEAYMLGMHETHFMDTAGLATKDHFTTAYDLALLGQYASLDPVLMKITATRYYAWNGQTLTNLNHVLFWYPGVDGIKPGWIPESGLCQVLDAQRGGHHVVVAILNTPNLVTDARNLLNIGLRDFSWVQSPLYGDGPAVTMAGKTSSVPYSYFIGSGHYLRGAFLSTYLRDGGPATLGFPRTEALTEGEYQVQYFQNGALSLGPLGPQGGSKPKMSRLPLGMDAISSPPPNATPTPKPAPKPTAKATATPVGTPHEGTVQLDKTPTPSKTPTPKPKGTATPHPTPTPTPASGPVVGSVFTGFQRLHASFLGAPVSKAQRIQGYSVQIFAYGALAYDPKSHAVSLLPIGDRFLAGRHFLPAHPGNAYPSGFASAAVLKTIGWLPAGQS